MNDITRAYYRAHFFIPLRYFAVAAICVCVMLFSGTYSRENLGIAAIVVSAFLCALTLWSLVDILTAPMRFKIWLKRLPESERGELADGLKTAKRLGKRWFSESHLVFFCKRRIKAMRFDEMRSADLKGNRLFIVSVDGKALPLPFEADENPAVIVAALRSKNEHISASIDGRVIDFGKKSKEKRTPK